MKWPIAGYLITSAKVADLMDINPAPLPVEETIGRGEIG
jgi:hypothetical protein